MLLALHNVPSEKAVLVIYLALEAGKGKPRDLYSALSIDEGAALPVKDVE